MIRVKIKGDKGEFEANFNTFDEFNEFQKNTKFTDLGNSKKEHSEDDHVDEDNDREEILEEARKWNEVKCLLEKAVDKAKYYDMPPSAFTTLLLAALKGDKSSIGVGSVSGDDLEVITRDIEDYDDTEADKSYKSDKSNKEGEVW